MPWLTVLALSVRLSTAGGGSDASPPSSAPAAWIGVGGRNAFGFESKLNADFGIELMAGAWVLDQILQPLVWGGWSHEAREGAVVDAARFGPGLGVGAPLWNGRVWLGAVVQAGYVHSWGRPAGAPVAFTPWSGMFGISALLQFRLAHYFLAGSRAAPSSIFPR